MTMAADTFLYPEIDKLRCVRCGRCSEVCAKCSDSKLKASVSCVAAVSKNDAVFAHSSSGGAFAAIVDSLYEIYKKQYPLFFVVGASWNEQLQVCHTIVEYAGPDSLRCLQSSKYVQSSTCGIYKKVKNLLADQSHFVVFSGTPCQVAGLKAFVGSSPNNLFCIDLICKGGPSQKVFDKYKEGLEKKFGLKISSYQFRCKERLDNGTLYTRSVRIGLSDGRVLRLSRLEDEYLRMFYSRLPKFREACVNCRYKSVERVGDMTIGDAWGIDKLYPQLKAIHGVSLVLGMTVRAAALKVLLAERMCLYPCRLMDIAADNSFACDYDPTPEFDKEQYYQDICDKSMSFEQCVQKGIDRINERE